MNRRKAMGASPRKLRGLKGSRFIERRCRLRPSTRRGGESVDVNEWQIAGIKEAIASMDRGEGVPHEQVEEWVRSWGRGQSVKEE